MSREQRAALDALLRTVPSDRLPLQIDRMRESFAAMMGQFAVPTVQISDTTVADRPALLIEPVGNTSPGTILYFHGGSYTLGSPRTAIGLTASLVSRTGIRAISVDYRLAPEHPFPSAIEDCLAAYRVLLESGVPAGSIAFAGESAGGGLTVSTTLSARSAGLPLPGAILAFSPGLDQTRTGASMLSKEGIDPFFTREGMNAMGALYLAGQDPHQELAAPALFADLTGFPPMMLQVGSNELLLDDSTRLAERAREAEVDIILDVTAGVPHVFQSFIGQLDEADHALARAALFLKQHLTRSPS